MQRALVLDACQRSALATTRSLGRQGVAVYTADDAPESLAGASRYSRQYLRYPDPKAAAPAFISSIKDILQQHDISLVMPMTELTSELLLNSDNLPDSVVIPFAGISTVNQLADKCELMKLAGRLNIPHPGSQFIQPDQNITDILESTDYPAVLKPARSWNSHGAIWSRAAVRIAADRQAALALLQQDAVFSQHPFMLQQYIPGHGAGIFALYNRGAPVAFFAHRRIREKPPQGGVSVLSESIETDRQMLAYTRKLLDSVNWHGVAMVEFKIADDKTPYLMEVNTRFWGSLQLAIDAGVDFPWLLYQIATGQTVEPVQDYRTGIRLRWLLGDLDSLYLTLRDKRYSPPHKLQAVWRFIRPSLQTRHEINRWGDMAPAWYELKQYIRDLVS
ncbi:MAG TPA: ATP-grasp domain-containing protein [Thiotrichales bacterium]|nr:ATP-grasp domain-containing protein [Thiotrichales bacterium]